jgi:hypothetical protein
MGMPENTGKLIILWDLNLYAMSLSKSALCMTFLLFSACKNPTKPAVAARTDTARSALAIPTNRSSLIAELKALHHLLVIGDTQRIPGYSDSIARYPDFPEFNEVFNQLNVDQLLKANELEIHADSATEPCTRFYRISVSDSDSTVEIAYGTSAVNSDYKPKTKKEKEYLEDLGGNGGCEHTIFWNFTWDGRKLYLRNQGAAD